MALSLNENPSARTLTLPLMSFAIVSLCFDPFRAGRTPFCTRKRVVSFPLLEIPWTSSEKYPESELSNGSLDSKKILCHN